jgi:hypothetical protein
VVHPIILGIALYFYDAPFLQLGDAQIYFDVVNHYYAGNRDFISEALDVISQLGLFGALAQLNLAITPFILIPQNLYESPSSEIYFLWQTTLSIILISLCATLATRWKCIREDYLFYIILYCVISPSFFELRSNLNRYGMLFFGVLLFYISFIALQKKTDAFKLAGLSTAIIAIAITKFLLLIPIFIFCIWFYIFAKRSILSIFLLVTIGIITVTITFSITQISTLYSRYIYIASTGAKTFSFLIDLPVIGYPIKLVYALLSPFPWHKAEQLTISTYGGNYFIFVMHIFSALFGVYFFSNIVLRFRSLFSLNSDLTYALTFGLIMSSSVFFGAIGYHAYLLIYFPFFAVLFAVPQYKISWLIPIAVVLSTELSYLAALFVLALKH